MAHVACMVQLAHALRATDGLLIVDVQPDFCPGGSLPIPRGDEVVPVVNAWIERFLDAGIPIYASRDWHPPHHLSFREQGGPWPAHCVQDTPGAAMHPGLNLPASAFLITKGCRLDMDQYSAFDETGAGSHMRARRITRIWVAGLALDVCVKATVLQARKLGFDAIVITDGCRPVSAEGGRRALEEMLAAGTVTA